MQIKKEVKMSHDKILKLAWDSRTNSYKKPTYWGAEPEALQSHIYNHEYGAASILLQQPYKGMGLFSNRLGDPTFKPPQTIASNSWQPRLYLRQGTVGIFNVWNWREEDMVNPEWEIMQFDSADPESGAESQAMATGSHTIPLEPDEIGVMVSQHTPMDKQTKRAIWQDAKMELNIYYPKDSTWFGEGRARDAAKYGGDVETNPQNMTGTGPDRDKGGIENLTNAEGAIFWIYLRGGNLKARKKLLEDFNLGSNDMEQNPRLKDLTNRGFFSLSGRDTYEGGKLVRALPILTDKGKAHAPEIDDRTFNQEFRQEVINNPDGPLMLKDHGFWVNPEEGFDVAEESRDKRPDYMRRFDD